MDKHEKGIEIDPLRPDLPLPKWRGTYRGDPKHLPKVVQKLMLRRLLTPEEKAELLWRFYELQQGARTRLVLILVLTIVFLLCIVGIGGYLVYNHQLPALASLAHPR